MNLLSIYPNIFNPCSKLKVIGKTGAVTASHNWWGTSDPSQIRVLGPVKIEKNLKHPIKFLFLRDKDWGGSKPPFSLNIPGTWEKALRGRKHEG